VFSVQVHGLITDAGDCNWFPCLTHTTRPPCWYEDSRHFDVLAVKTADTLTCSRWRQRTLWRARGEDSGHFDVLAVKTVDTLMCSRWRQWTLWRARGQEPFTRDCAISRRCVYHFNYSTNLTSFIIPTIFVRSRQSECIRGPASILSHGYLHVLPRLRIHGALPPTYISMAWCVSTGTNFPFIFYFSSLSYLFVRSFVSLFLLPNNETDFDYI
jgi:hypothetical protein